MAVNKRSVWLLSPTLKATTRTKRGKEIHRKVQDDSIAPSNIMDFFDWIKTKPNYFAYLSKEMMLTTDDQIVLTCAYATNCIIVSCKCRGECEINSNWEFIYHSYFIFIRFCCSRLFYCPKNHWFLLGFADFGKETCDFPFLLLLYY